MAKRYEGVPALEDYGIDVPTLREMYEEWNEKGTPKSVLERRYLGVGNMHGKLFSRLVREYLRKETEEEHPLRRKVRELEARVALLERTLRDNAVPIPDEGAAAPNQPSFFEETPDERDN